MPNFIASIYGPMTPIELRNIPPPMFAALSLDDPLFGHQGLGLVESWQKARGSFEFHLYAGGGHGLGLRKKGTASDFWVKQYLAWMKAKGFLMQDKTCKKEHYAFFLSEPCVIMTTTAQNRLTSGQIQ